MSQEIAKEFFNALKASDRASLEKVLVEDAGMRIGRWDGAEAYRPRHRVITRLLQETSGWRDATWHLFGVVADEQRAALEFRVQATENGRYVEHNRAAFLALRADKIQTIDLYCPETFPSAPRQHDKIVPATLSDDELSRYFETFEYMFDVREWMPANFGRRVNRDLSVWDSEDAHPGSNRMGNARWTGDEADARIEEMIAHYRARNAGFTWFTGPFDSPPDLRMRLEKHGLALAGEQALMVRTGLENLSDIPVNAHVELELLDGSNATSIEAALQIAGACFHLTPEQIAQGRPSHFERIRNPEFRAWEFSFLARLDGTPVADGRLLLRGGIAYLGGASTLPEYRGQKIYSTLLRKRLEIAHERGYHVAAIHAEPMSRRVVSKFGFRELARYYIYGWMPVMDMDVIRSLVPDE